MANTHRLPWMVVGLAVVQILLLVLVCDRHSPTTDGPFHLAASLRRLKDGDFSADIGNPKCALEFQTPVSTTPSAKRIQFSDGGPAGVAIPPTTNDFDLIDLAEMLTSSFSIRDDGPNPDFPVRPSKLIPSFKTTLTISPLATTPERAQPWCLPPGARSTRMGAPLASWSEIDSISTSASGIITTCVSPEFARMTNAAPPETAIRSPAKPRYLADRVNDGRSKSILTARPAYRQHLPRVPSSTQFQTRHATAAF
jgi:hypothetical protein